MSVREDRREEEKEPEGADTALKAKTPHVRWMARERRGAGSSLVSMETPYYKTIY